jgi:hypothetical protein
MKKHNGLHIDFWKWTHIMEYKNARMHGKVFNVEYMILFEATCKAIWLWKLLNKMKV